MYLNLDLFFILNVYSTYMSSSSFGAICFATYAIPFSRVAHVSDEFGSTLHVEAKTKKL